LRAVGCKNACQLCARATAAALVSQMQPTGRNSKDANAGARSVGGHWETKAQQLECGVGSMHWVLNPCWGILLNRVLPFRAGWVIRHTHSPNTPLESCNESALDVLRSGPSACGLMILQREQSNCAHSLLLPFIAPSLHAPEVGLAEFRLCLVLHANRARSSDEPGTCAVRRRQPTNVRR